MPPFRASAHRFALSLIAVVALVAGLVTVPAITGTISSASAAGTPDVQLTRTVAAQTLYGRDVAVTLQATAPDSTPDVDGFNLTFSDVLPAGATVTSTTFPITERITQVDGTTLLIWTNVADLLDDASVTLDYTFRYPILGQAGQRDVGDSFAGTAHAYVNTDPFTIPNPMTTPADGSVWEDVSGSATASSTTQLVPYLVDVQELTSPEAELLRGVHADKTVYEITVTNNTVAPTTNPDVTAYLPASLEFLGCVAADNSAAPEYPGAPSIAASFPTLVGCNTQYTATAVTTDPDGAGSRPNAVYTRVLWDQLPDLLPSGVIPHAVRRRDPASRQRPGGGQPGREPRQQHGLRGQRRGCRGHLRDRRGLVPGRQARSGGVRRRRHEHRDRGGRAGRQVEQQRGDQPAPGHHLDARLRDVGVPAVHRRDHGDRCHPGRSGLGRLVAGAHVGTGHQRRRHAHRGLDHPDHGDAVDVPDHVPDHHAHRLPPHGRTGVGE